MLTDFIYVCAFSCSYNYSWYSYQVTDFTYYEIEDESQTLGIIIKNTLIHFYKYTFLIMSPMCKH